MKTLIDDDLISVISNDSFESLNKNLENKLMNY